MIPVPKIFRKTKTVKQINAYMASSFNEVLHTTLNPNGPGAIRIHLIPPKPEEGAFNPSVAIINGTDIVPVNFIWAIMLAEMIRETNKYDGRQIDETDIQHILDQTAGNVRQIVPVLSGKRIRRDIRTIYQTLRQIAYREEVTTDVHYMAIGDYAEYMSAPHSCTIFAISGIWRSKSPSVLGLVIIMAAMESSSSPLRSSTSTMPSAVLFTSTISSPQTAAEAGLVP